jgi:hypothetical protein
MSRHSSGDLEDEEFNDVPHTMASSPTPTSRPRISRSSESDESSSGQLADYLSPTPKLLLCDPVVPGQVENITCAHLVASGPLGDRHGSLLDEERSGQADLATPPRVTNGAQRGAARKSATIEARSFTHGWQSGHARQSAMLEDKIVTNEAQRKGPRTVTKTVAQSSRMMEDWPDMHQRYTGEVCSGDASSQLVSTVPADGEPRSHRRGSTTADGGGAVRRRTVPLEPQQRRNVTTMQTSSDAPWLDVRQKLDQEIAGVENKLARLSPPVTRPTSTLLEEVDRDGRLQGRVRDEPSARGQLVPGMGAMALNSVHQSVAMRNPVHDYGIGETSGYADARRLLHFSTVSNMTSRKNTSELEE